MQGGSLTTTGMNMFGNLKNLAGLMGQAGQIKEKVAELQESLGRVEVEGEAGAGAVRVVANGKMEVLSVELDRPLLSALAGEGDEADLRMVEDLVASAVNAALARARETAQEEIGRLTGDLNLPGLDQFLK